MFRYIIWWRVIVEFFSVDILEQILISFTFSWTKMFRWNTLQSKLAHHSWFLKVYLKCWLKFLLDMLLDMLRKHLLHEGHGSFCFKLCLAVDKLIQSWKVLRKFFFFQTCPKVSFDIPISMVSSHCRTIFLTKGSRGNNECLHAICNYKMQCL